MGPSSMADLTQPKPAGKVHSNLSEILAKAQPLRVSDVLIQLTVLLSHSIRHETAKIQDP